jgi:hypothetical protein
MRNVRGVFRCDDFEALRSAALAGMGIAFLPTWIVGQDVKAGTLTRLSLDAEPWNATPSRIHLLRALPQPGAKVRALMRRFARPSVHRLSGSPDLHLCIIRKDVASETALSSCIVPDRVVTTLDTGLMSPWLPLLHRQRRFLPPLFF